MSLRGANRDAVNLIALNWPTNKQTVFNKF
jgi:hypothetical protein